MAKISLFRFDASSCNGCDIEVVACLVPRYGLAALDVEVVDDPTKANAIVITGGVNHKTEGELKRVYGLLKEPRTVIAVGACGCSKGVFKEGYPMTGPVDNVLPVAIHIPGCPVKPQAIIQALAGALGASVDAKGGFWEVPDGFRGKHEVDAKKCTGCGACANMCPSDAIVITDEGDVRRVSFNYWMCIFCGTCEEVCPEKAVRLGKDYRLWFKEKKDAKVSVNVPLQRGKGDGTPSISKRQIEASLARAEKRVPGLGKFHEELAKSAVICPGEKMDITEVRAAKALLLRTGEAKAGSSVK